MTPAELNNDQAFFRNTAWRIGASRSLASDTSAVVLDVLTGSAS